MPRPKSLHTIILEAALPGLEAQLQRLDQQIAQVKAMLGPMKPAAVAEAPAKPRRRKLSVAARKRIAAAQRKRWAEFNKKARRGK